MAEEIYAIKGNPLTAVFLAVCPEPFLFRHWGPIRAWNRSVGDSQQDMLFVLK
jgi:hypothetical protein